MDRIRDLPRVNGRRSRRPWRNDLRQGGQQIS
jgi:hypothetical protein